MAIKKFDVETDVLRNNQWICRESIFVEGGVDRPARVASVSGTRIYFEVPRGDDIETGHCTVKTVLYVADTQDEATALWTLDKERRRELKEALQRVTDEVTHKYDNRIKEMLSSSAPALIAESETEAESAPTTRRRRPG